MGVLKSIQIGTIPVSLSHSMGYKSGTVGDYFSLEMSATNELGYGASKRRPILKAGGGGAVSR